MSEGSPQAPGRPCPICGKPSSGRHGRFCSSRCATIDLARWITGGYRVPGEEAPEDAQAPEEREE